MSLNMNLRLVVLVAILIFSKSWIKCKTKTKLLLQMVIHEIQDGHCCSTEYQGKCHRTLTDWLKIVVLVAKFVGEEYAKTTIFPISVC